MESFQIAHQLFGITHLESMIHLRRDQLLDLHKQKLKNVSEFSLFCYSRSIPGFSISRLVNIENFFNVNILFKYKLNINVSLSDHSFYLCSMLLKTSFLLPPSLPAPCPHSPMFILN